MYLRHLMLVYTRKIDFAQTANKYICFHGDGAIAECSERKQFSRVRSGIYDLKKKRIHDPAAFIDDEKMKKAY